jgi:hypothetical protein
MTDPDGHCCPTARATNEGISPMRRGKIACGALIAAAAAATVTAQAAVAAPAASGVVVDYRAQSTTATVATQGGGLLALHSNRVREGSRVRVTAMRQLGNGTLAGRLTVIGKARRATVRGVVAAQIGRRAIALSGPGTTFMIRLNRSSRKSALQVTPQYGVGSTVSVDVKIDPKGNLNGEDVTVVNGVPLRTLELEGMVKTVGTGTTAPTVDPTTGCVTGLTSASLPVGWLALSVGEHDLSLTAFVKLAPATTPPAPTTGTTTTTTTAPTPPVAPTFAAGQEVELHVNQVLSTTTSAPCDNQFQLTSASANGDEQEADEDSDHGEEHNDGDRHGRGHGGGDEGGGDGEHGGGNDDD